MLNFFVVGVEGTVKGQPWVITSGILEITWELSKAIDKLNMTNLLLSNNKEEAAQADASDILCQYAVPSNLPVL